MVSNDDKYTCLLDFDPLPVPLDPTMTFCGIDPDIYIFNSALTPLKLNLKLIDHDLSSFGIMLKMGDDLRQDQLVIQLISLMDDLLKRENLDLKLTYYRVLATKRDLGILELVPNCMNIADVLTKYDKDLKKYMRAFHAEPGNSETYGIAPHVLSNFVKSCGM